MHSKYSIHPSITIQSQKAIARDHTSDDLQKNILKEVEPESNAPLMKYVPPHVTIIDTIENLTLMTTPS